MGKIRETSPVKLISGFIFKRDSAYAKARIILNKRFGKIDFESECLPFVYTDYYEKEFGGGLKRKFISFRRLISPDELYKIKLFTNKIEEKFLDNNNRLINIDPGYLDMSKLVLASTKDYKHRIYLAKGIFAEITLFYQNKTFQPWDWTYNDYKTPEYISIFNHIRDLYVDQVKA
jgi:hypothetical protein